MSPVYSYETLINFRWNKDRYISDDITLHIFKSKV
jgi:hypothetical protein